MISLSESQLERYSRHLMLDEVGLAGQERMCNSRVLVIGAGGLGSPAAFYLAAAGVGTLGIADGDVVDLSNLQRQILHTTEEVGRAKVASAESKLRALNPDVNVVAYDEMVTVSNIHSLVSDYDFIIDGTDSFASKFLINDACVLSQKPYCHAGILKFSGQLMTVIPHETACYRCVFMEPPRPGTVPSCSQAGILGVIAGTIGTLQAGEALKYILGSLQLYTNRLCRYDARQGTFDLKSVRRNPRCHVCGTQPTITELQEERYDVQPCNLTTCTPGAGGACSC